MYDLNGKDRKSINVIKGSIRIAFRRSKLYKAVVKRARREVQEGFYKNKKPKIGVWYECAICRKNFKPDQIEVDHIEEVGPFDGSFDNWVARVYCDIDNLQVLCKGCHKEKTKVYNKTMEAAKLL